jgi:hypothetical protein
VATKNTVEVTYKVKEDGKLGKVAQQADKVAKSTDKLGKSNAKTVKGLKGVGQAGLSAGKGFSKMRNVMGDDGSGLVAAYATLAANVFALTAAFAALSGAFQAETLVKSVQFLGNEVGRSLDSTVKKLQEVTDGAISTEAALRGVALGTSAGFSTEQITGLAEVARGASLALGRDMGDAFDRLIRGTAKLEPEILDELGIIVRLDQAYEAYAIELGKTATQLTTVEKTQAFANATLDSGTSKFGDLGKAIKSNPYDKLIASLVNLKNAFVKLLNETLKFGKLASFLSENMGALVGVVALFVSTIAGKLLPVLFGSAAAMHASALAAKEMAVSQLDGLSATTKGAKGWNSFIGGLEDGTKTIEDADEGHTALNRSISQHEVQVKKLKKADKDGTAEMEKQKRAIADLTQKKRDLYVAQQMNLRASAKETASSAIQHFSNFNLKLGYADLRKSVTDYGTSLTVTGVQATGFTGVLNTLRTAAFATGVGLKAAGAMALSAFGWVSAVASIVYTLYELLKDKFFPPDLVKDRTDAILKSIEQLRDIHKQYESTLKTGVDKQMAGLRMVSGAMQQQAEKIAEVIALHKREQAAAVKTATEASVAAKKGADSALVASLDAGANIARIKGKIAALPWFSLENAALQNELKVATETGRLTGEAYTVAKAEALAASTSETETKALGDDKALEEGLGAIDKVITEMSNGDLKTLFQPAIDQLTELKTSGAGLEEINTTIKKMQDDGIAVEGFIKGIGSAVSELEKAQNKFGAKATTPYDEILKAAEGVEMQFLDLAKAGDALADSTIANLEALTGTKVTDIFGGTGSKVTKYVKDLKASLKTIRQFAGVQKVNKQAQKLIASTQKSSLVSLKAQHVLEKESVAQKRALYDATVLANQAAFANKTLDDDGLVNAIAKNDLLLAEVVLEEALNDSGIAAVEASTLDLNLQKEALGLSNKVLEAQDKALSLKKQSLMVDAQINAFKDYGKKSGRAAPVVTANEVYLIHKRTESDTLVMLELQKTSALAMADLDSKMVAMKFRLIMAQLRAAKMLDPDEEKRLSGYIATLNSALEITKANITTEFDLRKKKLTLEGLQKEENAKKSIVTGASTGATTADRISSTSDALAGTAVAAVKAKAATATTPAVEAQDAIPAITFESLEFSDKIAVVNEQLAPMMANLRALGPDGELIASLGEGSMVMAESFGILSEKIGEGTATTADKLQAVGAMIGAIGGIVAAASKAKIAGIDKEIAAEQKRDGKSVASMAKIAALEKKKEAVKKKAFAINKKLMMAQVVVSTAAGMASATAAAAAASVAAGAGAPVAFAAVLGMMSGIILGVGAAQLALIAGTSYQGGGSVGGAAPAPSTVSIGKRGSEVDLASSKSASGELGYLRGDSGVGGAGNFKPTSAFAGYQGRASGGYIVGEQGPEVFMPQTPGNIIPSGQDMGGATNVNFSINAVDASGVEDLLIDQRGTLIGMMREAANSHGQDFMEGVDTSIYTPSTAGATRY